MYITHCKQDDGDYVDANGERYSVTIIAHPTKCTKEHLTPFRSLEAALKEWGLTYAPVPSPSPEK